MNNLFTYVNSSKKSLHSEKIVHTALSILNNHGVAGLSMRRLGAELNVEAASLYHHFPNRDALIQKIVDTVSAQAIVQIEPSVTWSQALYSSANKYKDSL